MIFFSENVWFAIFFSENVWFAISYPPTIWFECACTLQREASYGNIVCSVRVWIVWRCFFVFLRSCVTFVKKQFLGFRQTIIFKV